MKCPRCDKEMGRCINGTRFDAVYFNNCPDCNIQLDDNGYVLAFDGNNTYKSNVKLINEEKNERKT